MLLMTDGRDVNSKRNVDDVIQEAKRRNVRIYTLGLGEPGLNFPVRTVLVLDRSGSMSDRGKMDALKQAARRFIHLMPAESADTTIIAFSHIIPMASDFTRKKDRLLKQIDDLFPLGGTTLFDAIYEGVETLNAGHDVEGRKPRRSLVVLSDGKDENSRRSAREVIRRAQKDEIRVHIMGLGLTEDIDEPTMKEITRETGGLYFPVPDAGRLTDVFEELSITLHDDGVDEASLRRLADQTGGEYYHVRDADKLSSVFERVASHLENTYSVTFASRRARYDGTARQIEIRFGDLAGATEAYTTHGLITPMGSPRLSRFALYPRGPGRAADGPAPPASNGVTAAMSTHAADLTPRTPHDLDEPIVALSSALGSAVRAILRLSGRNVWPVVRGCIPPPCPAPESMTRGRWRVSLQLAGLHAGLPAQVFLWPGPRSYTGQDVIELHTISSPPLIDLLLTELQSRGADGPARRVHVAGVSAREARPDTSRGSP